MSKKILAGLVGSMIVSFSGLSPVLASQNNIYIQNYLYSGSTYSPVAPVVYSYYIRTAQELNWVSYMVSTGYTFEGYTIEIINDLDFRNIDYMPIGTYYTPFQGTLNGNGHAIKNMHLNFPGYYGIGLVGYLGARGTVKNVDIASSCRFSAYGTLGGIAGWNSGTILHCSSAADLHACNGYVGGIVGYNDFSGIVDSCEVASFSRIETEYGGHVRTFAGYNCGTLRRCKTFWFYPW